MSDDDSIAALGDQATSHLNLNEIALSRAVPICRQHEGLRGRQHGSWEKEAPGPSPRPVPDDAEHGVGRQVMRLLEIG
ncbi:hypothetical protein, partial [Mycolicibacterium sp.]|uniref:hypothetical protein n=1 Tax=Mycolicibacterium sp. TaxID=2320850 RepID=UPI0037CC4C4E